MARIAIFFVCLVYFSKIQAASSPDKKTICLNMIVKDESQVIRRCLESVKNIIDYWVIVDTGSLDGTQNLIKDFMQMIPGELHERPWKNFAHNRNEALALAKGKADYVFVIDADDTLNFSETFNLPILDKDFYNVLSKNLGTKYYRLQLINNHLDWQWIGVVHEGLVCQQAKSSGVLEGVVNIISYDGNRSSDPLKYQKDAEILEEAIKTDPTNSRSIFYLAQSYRDAGNFEAALRNYKKRVSLGGSDEEVFWSLSELAKLQDQLCMSSDIVIDGYYKAFQYKPWRAEPLYYLARKYRIAGNYSMGYAISRLALSIPLPDQFLFIENWIYDYGLLQEFAECAFWLKKYDEAEAGCRLLLSKNDIPPELRKAYERNLEILSREYH